jgi:hypothetical protein
MPRSRLPVLAVVLLAVVALVARPSTDEAGGERKGTTSQQDALLRSGEVRYTAYVRAERASQAERVRAGDPEGASIHANRIAPALRARSGGPLRLVRAAADVLSLDARLIGRQSLLDVESHAAGAGVAFDAVRDALWARDKAMTGAIDERLAGLRAELDRHRRGTGFVSSGALDTADRRRLAAALDALAWRLTLVTERLAA